MSQARQWPTFNYASAKRFLNKKKQRKILAKQRKKDKSVWDTLGTVQEEGNHGDYGVAVNRGL